MLLPVLKAFGLQAADSEEGQSAAGEDPEADPGRGGIFMAGQGDARQSASGLQDFAAGCRLCELP